MASTMYSPQIYTWARPPGPNTDPQGLNAGGGTVVSRAGRLIWPQGLKGVCGDPYFGIQHHVAPIGKWWSNRTMSFSPSSQVDFTMVLTANHLGYVQYSYCRISDTGLPDANEACLTPGKNNMLKLAGRQDGEWRTFVNGGQSVVMSKVVLPSAPGRYVIRLHYVTGNSCIDPAVIPIIGNARNLQRCGVGGAYPEEFWNCADVLIRGTSAPFPSLFTTTTTNTKITTTSSSTSTSTTTSSTSSTTSSTSTETAMPEVEHLSGAPCQEKALTRCDKATSDQAFVICVPETVETLTWMSGHCPLSTICRDWEDGFACFPQ
jgi:hypothetical protein